MSKQPMEKKREGVIHTKISPFNEKKITVKMNCRKHINADVLVIAKIVFQELCYIAPYISFSNLYMLTTIGKRE